jgi:hypothetical protein
MQPSVEAQPLRVGISTPMARRLIAAHQCPPTCKRRGRRCHSLRVRRLPGHGTPAAADQHVSRACGAWEPRGKAKGAK